MTDRSETNVLRDEAVKFAKKSIIEALCMCFILGGSTVGIILCWVHYVW